MFDQFVDHRVSLGQMNNFKLHSYLYPDLTAVTVYHRTSLIDYQIVGIGYNNCSTLPCKNKSIVFCPLVEIFIFYNQIQL